MEREVTKRTSEISPTTRNLAYGMLIRLRGMARRGEPQDKINALQERYEALMNMITKADGDAA